MGEVSLQSHLSPLLPSTSLDGSWVLLSAPPSQGSPAASRLLPHFLSSDRGGQRPAFLPFLAGCVSLTVQVVRERRRVFNCVQEHPFRIVPGDSVWARGRHGEGPDRASGQPQSQKHNLKEQQ